MTVNNSDSAEFLREGENPFAEESENDNSESSQDETNNDEGTQSDEGDGNTQSGTEKLPFNEHPRWQERDAEWHRRLNDQEIRHQDDLKKIREEFSGTRKANAENTDIPSWFGGTQEQWELYRRDRDAEMKAAEDRAYERINSAKSSEEKAVAEATAHMQSEIAAIESDKTLNPNGQRVDPNKLVKFVIDNDLVDSKGKWNYRAGWRLMNASSAPKSDKKVIASATTSESRGESRPAPYKTSDDFKKNRPW